MGARRTAARPAELEDQCGILCVWEAMVLPPHDRPAHELANLLLCGRLQAEAALQRTESRGGHYREDFREPRDSWLRHIVFRVDAPRQAA